jgi:hypothetical protein
VAIARDEGRGVTITTEISQDPPPSSHSNRLPLRISQFISSIDIYSTFFSLQHTPYAAALNHHLGGFGPECARFGRGVPKKFARLQSRQARIRRARNKPSVGDRHLGLCHAYARVRRARMGLSPGKKKGGERKKKLKKSFWLWKVKEERGERSSGIGCRVSCDAF